jgi:hypothetical protein
MSDIGISRMRIYDFLQECSEEVRQEILSLIPILGTEAVALFIDELEAGTV